MIAFLKGKLAGRTANQALIDVGGVGYAVFMSGTALSRLPETGAAVYVLTYLQVSEAGVALYGFLTERERALFEELIGVSGIGPKVALAALGFFEPDDLVRAIAAEDVKAVSRIPGVGKKTAQRMILELKGSLADFGATGAAAGVGEKATGVAAAAAPQTAREVVTDALLSMGFTAKEAELALKGAPDDGSESVLLQYALKKLGS